MENTTLTDIKEFYISNKRRKIFVILSLFIISIIVFLYSLSVGTAGISLNELLKILLGKILKCIDISNIKEYELNSYIIFSVRLPRIILAAMTGLTLGAAGAIMQSILRNPLASPFTLGVSNGAAFGAALAIVLGSSILNIKAVQATPWIIAFNAFIFGFISLFLVYSIGKVKGGSTTILLLSGIAVGSLFSAGVSILKYFSSNEALKDLDLWLMGGFWGANYKSIIMLLPIVIISLIIIMKISWDLNAIASGEELASTLGININKTIFIALTVVTLMSSAVTAFSGVIGFIGLVAPHISRTLIGTDNRYLIPCSALLGEIILLFSDTLGRTIISPIEIPVGIITSLIGAPFFIYILIKKDKNFT